MMRISSLAWLTALTAALLATGCRLLEPETSGKSPLSTLGSSAESITLEIFFARLPAGNASLETALWNEIDEQAIPAATRRELSDNGVRAGLVGSHVPIELARLLTLTDQPQKTQVEQTVNLEAEPAVTMRLLSVRPGRRSEIVTSSTYDQLPLLMRESGQVVGRTYAKAEGRFALRAMPSTAGRVEIDLLPELHYGEQQQRWNATEGVIRLEAARPKRVFEALRLKTDLAPGQMLALTCLVDRPGSLGHYFFTEPKADALLQKIVVIRLAGAGADHTFAAAPEKIDPVSPSEPSDDRAP